MPGLLRDLTEDDPLDAPRTRALIVNGEPYVNAAAKFWPGLLDELTEQFPQGTLLELSATTGRRLDPELLFPENELQRQLDALRDADTDDALSEALAELELLGPPGPVQARVFCGTTVILNRTLPLESVDAETFAYLLAWQLRWAGIPARRWNERCLSGRLCGRDPDRARLYRMTFSMTGQPLAEGLLRRSLTLVPEIRTARNKPD
jgi:hypothetical protein